MKIIPHPFLIGRYLIELTNFKNEVIGYVVEKRTPKHKRLLSSDLFADKEKAIEKFNSQ